VRLLTPTVGIQGLREAERLIHQDQGVIERDRVEHRRRINATERQSRTESDRSLYGG